MLYEHQPSGVLYTIVEHIDDQGQKSLWASKYGMPPSHGTYVLDAFGSRSSMKFEDFVEHKAETPIEAGWWY